MSGRLRGGAAQVNGLEYLVGLAQARAAGARPDPGPALSQSVWMVDAVGGSNSNTGLVGSPIASIAEIFRRLGTCAPRWSHTVSIGLLSNIQNADAWAGYCPVFLAGGSCQVSGAQTLLATTTVATYTPANFAAGTPPTVQAAAGFLWASLVGAYVLDTNHGCSFRVDEDLGAGLAVITMPRTTPDGFVAEYGTVEDGDTLEVYSQFSLPVEATPNQGGEGILRGLRFFQLNITTPNLLGKLSPDTQFAECAFPAGSVWKGVGSNENLGLFGCWWQGNSGFSQFSGAGQFFGGSINGAGTDFGDGTVLDGDVRVPLRIHWIGNGAVLLARVYFGQTNDTDSAPGNFGIDGSQYGSNRVWGPAGWNATNNRLINQNGAASMASQLLLTGSLTVGGGSYYFDSGTGAYAFDNGNPNTPVTTAGVDTRGGYTNPTTGDGIFNAGTV